MFIMMDDKQHYNTQHILKFRKTKLIKESNKQIYHRYVFTLTDGSEVTQTMKANSIMEEILLRDLNK